MSQVGFKLQIPFQQYDIVHSLYVVATVISIMYECLCYHTQEIPVTPKNTCWFLLNMYHRGGKKKYSDLTTHLTDRCLPRFSWRVSVFLGSSISTLRNTKAR